MGTSENTARSIGPGIAQVPGLGVAAESVEEMAIEPSFEGNGVAFFELDTQTRSRNEVEVRIDTHTATLWSGDVLIVELSFDDIDVLVAARGWHVRG
jgi:hypothetical protein